VGTHPATLQRCETQSVSGGIPTQSVETINLQITENLPSLLMERAGVRRIK